MEALVKQQAKHYYRYISAIRRHLHANPELSFYEYDTAAFIRKKLDEWGIERKVLANTGTVALLQGTKSKRAGPVIALRADIDALPIWEENQVAYVSQRPGVMHACGHDAHMAMMLGVIRILASLREHFSGTIKFIFQPAEEVLPGGAGCMIAAGVLKDPVPQLVIGQHVRPDLPCGSVSLVKGSCMASMDEITMRVQGRGGHAAQPDRIIDPVLTAAQLVVALQQVVSRMARPQTPSVLSFGKLIASGTFNIIPDQVLLEGTFRTFNETWRTEAHHKIKLLAESIATGMGATCTVDIRRGYPTLHNNETLTEELTAFAIAYLGAEKVLPGEPWMAAEDFAWYAQQLPSVFYFLGTGKSDGSSAPLHNAAFDIDEAALETGAGLMAWLTLKKLETLANEHS